MNAKLSYGTIVHFSVTTESGTYSGKGIIKQVFNHHYNIELLEDFNGQDAGTMFMIRHAEIYEP